MATQSQSRKQQQSNKSTLVVVVATVSLLLVIALVNASSFISGAAVGFVLLMFGVSGYLSLGSDNSRYEVKD